MRKIKTPKGNINKKKQKIIDRILKTIDILSENYNVFKEVNPDILNVKYPSIIGLSNALKNNILYILS